MKMNKFVFSLLTNVSPKARVLCLNNRQATISMRTNSMKTFPVQIDSLTQLPFNYNSFDCVFLAGQLINKITPKALTEITRILKPNGQCLIKVRSYIPPSVCLWRRILAGSPLLPFRVFILIYNGTRLSEIIPSTQVQVKSVREKFYEFRQWLQAPYQAIVLTKTSINNRNPIIEELLYNVSSQIGSELRHCDLHLKRFLVRKIGKMLIIAATSSGLEYVIRIPLSQIAVERAKRNFNALNRIHANTVIPEHIKSHVPRAIICKNYQGYEYYVEEKLLGFCLEFRKHTSKQKQDAMLFITDLHLATKQPKHINQVQYKQLFESPLRVIKSHRLNDWIYDVLAKMEHYIKKCILGCVLPLTWSHGDFWSTNCLYDTFDRLSGVVDWELFSEHSLPLLDLLQFMNSHPAWHHLRIFRDIEQFKQPQFLSKYIEEMQIPSSAVSALILMHWVDYIANRINSRYADRNWMETKVYYPLTILREVF